jgi:hypothetical protein
VGSIGIGGSAGEVPGGGQWRLRCGSDSGEMRGPANACVGVGAQVEAREELSAICGPIGFPVPRHARVPIHR